MAQANELTCTEAQQLMQRLLDRRHDRATPKLHEHFQTCQPCQLWKCLLQYEPVETSDLLPADFSARVVSRLRREEARRLWPCRGSLFATAAAVVLALFLGKILVGNPQHAPEIALQPRPDLNQFVTTVSRDIESLPGRFKQLSPSWAVPEIIISLPTPDPWEASLPPLRTLGGTFQGAVEPLEAPAREAYEKVIKLIDEPEIQKFWRTVKQSMG